MTKVITRVGNPPLPEPLVRQYSIMHLLESQSFSHLKVWRAEAHSESHKSVCIVRAWLTNSLCLVLIRVPAALLVGTYAFQNSLVSSVPFVMQKPFDRGRCPPLDFIAQGMKRGMANSLRLLHLPKWSSSEAPASLLECLSTSGSAVTHWQGEFAHLWNAVQHATSHRACSPVSPTRRIKQGSGRSVMLCFGFFVVSAVCIVGVLVYWMGTSLCSSSSSAASMMASMCSVVRLTCPIVTTPSRKMSCISFMTRSIGAACIRELTHFSASKACLVSPVLANALSEIVTSSCVASAVVLSSPMHPGTCLGMFSSTIR